MKFPKARVLCTEDDEDTRELIILELTHAGFEVVSVDNAQEALALARTGHFDLYLMDNWLPGISGEDLTKKIREFDSKTPILFYSGAAFESDKERARAAGAQGYLVKPVEDDELINEIVRLIADSKVIIPIGLILPGKSDL